MGAFLLILPKIAQQKPECQAVNWSFDLNDGVKMTQAFDIRHSSFK